MWRSARATGLAGVRTGNRGGGRFASDPNIPAEADTVLPPGGTGAAGRRAFRPPNDGFPELDERRTNERHPGGIRRMGGRRGSITLEAALTLPWFLLAVLFLILLVRTAIIAMALHAALSQTVRLGATVWQPVALAQEQARSGDDASGSRDGGTSGSGNGETAETGNGTPAGSVPQEYAARLADGRQTLERLGDWLPEPFGEWARRAASGEWSPDSLAARAGFRQLALRFADTGVLDPSRLEIREVTLPSGDPPGESFLVVKASYRLPFRVPFLNRALTISASAAERVWIGGRPLPSGGNRTQESGAGHLVFLSLEPDPVRPGKKATLTLQARPGETVHLTVFYKSGPSQAKNLGAAVADAEGKVTWVWHVSGRTTPGEWSWEATAADGSILRRHFTVVGKETVK